jgi:hypothetical protein
MKPDEIELQHDGEGQMGCDICEMSWERDIVNMCPWCGHNICDGCWELHVETCGRLHEV